MSQIKGLLIIGFGGHARSVANVALSLGIKELLFTDENAKDQETFLGFSVQKEFKESLKAGWMCFPAAGNNWKREEQMKLAQLKEWPIATLISPLASVGVGSQISIGCFIAHQAHIGPYACIGKGTIINTAAVVEHECEIGEYAHVSVSSTIAGRSRIGNFGFVGAGATIIDHLVITDNVIIGAGGVVTKNIDKAGTYVGAPVHQI